MDFLFYYHAQRVPKVEEVVIFECLAPWILFEPTNKEKELEGKGEILMQLKCKGQVEIPNLRENAICEAYGWKVEKHSLT